MMFTTKELGAMPVGTQIKQVWNGGLDVGYIWLKHSVDQWYTADPVTLAIHPNTGSWSSRELSRWYRLVQGASHGVRLNAPSSVDILLEVT